MTSNPAIIKKAIAEDAEIKKMAFKVKMSTTSTRPSINRMFKMQLTYSDRYTKELEAKMDM